MSSEPAPRRGGLLALASASGLPLGQFRADHVAEQVRRACTREGCADAQALAVALTGDPRARARFRRSVAISHAGCFRDPHQYALLEQELLPPLLERRRRLAVWSAGCADGSELYSLGILLERMGALDRTLLLGSDLLEENLALARAGRYEGREISRAVRARVRWEQRDLVADGPPPGHWALILCRNVAIYLAPHARAALHRGLAAALAPHGVLLLGRSERLVDPHAIGLRPIASHAYGRLA